MKLLALSPGTLTRELFAGRRASFVTRLLPWGALCGAARARDARLWAQLPAALVLRLQAAIGFRDGRLRDACSSPSISGGRSAAPTVSRVRAACGARPLWGWCTPWRSRWPLLASSSRSCSCAADRPVVRFLTVRGAGSYTPDCSSTLRAYASDSFTSTQTSSRTLRETLEKPCPATRDVTGRVGLPTAVPGNPRTPIGRTAARVREDREAHPPSRRRPVSPRRKPTSMPRRPRVAVPPPAAPQHLRRTERHRERPHLRRPRRLSAPA